MNESDHKNQRFGNLGEQVASDYLENAGFKILNRNFRSPFGEIDLIASKSDALYFVEVKARHTHSSGSPFEQVTKAKQRKIIRTATHYLSRINPPREVFLSVCGVDLSQTPPQIDFLADAFQTS